MFSLLDRVENILGKGENAVYLHFLHFPQCFQEASSSGSLEVGIVWSRVRYEGTGNSFDNNQFFYLGELGAFGYDKNNRLIDQGHIHVVFAGSVCPFVCLSAKNFKIGHNFRTLSDRAFLFHMCIPCGKTFSLVSRSSVKVKIKYQTREIRKMAIAGTFVFNKHILFYFTELESFADDHFQNLLCILILTHQLWIAFENIVGKEEIARNKQFLLFPRCFLLNQIIVPPSVHTFVIISLFAVELEEPEIGIVGKGLTLYHTTLTFNDLAEEVQFETLWEDKMLVLVFCSFYHYVFYLFQSKLKMYESQLICGLQMPSVWTCLKFCCLVKSFL